MPFLSKLAVRREGVNDWVLLDDFTWVDPKTGQRVTAEAGFHTDFASVPQWCQSICPRTGISDEAAVIHDKRCDALDHGRPIASSTETDRGFRRMLKEDGAGIVQRNLMYAGVRWGALANPARRPGWLATGPEVLAISALALAFVAGVVLGAHEALNALLGRF